MHSYDALETTSRCLASVQVATCIRPEGLRYTLQAKDIVAKAEIKTKAFEENSIRSLEQAGRDLLISIGKRIEIILEDIVLDSVGKSLSPEILTEMMVKLATAYAEKGFSDSRIEMLVSAEEGTSVEDFVVYLKSEYIDAAYMQQDAFNDIDGATPEERQKYVFGKIVAILKTDMAFKTKAEARTFFQGITQVAAEVDLIILGGMGLKYDDYLFFQQFFEEHGALTRSTLYIHTAADPTVECILVPDTCLAVAEQFALNGKRLSYRLRSERLMARYRKSWRKIKKNGLTLQPGYVS